MTRYVVTVVPAVEKQLNGLRDRALRARLYAAIAGLRDDPRPPGVKKMVGSADEWRVRVGTWRVVYRVDDGRLVVLVAKAGSRADVYR